MKTLLLPLLFATGCAESLYLDDPAITNHVDDWRDEVIYQVLVDRFADGDVNNDFNVSWDPDDLARYQGGDYQGLVDHVDYLEALGVTTIWISPVVDNVEEDAGVAGYHGYWTQDFASVNPHFGDLAKLRELVNVMHQHDIKVVVDIVVNHVGQLFYYDINRNGQGDITAYYAVDGSDTLDLVTEWDPAFDPRRIQSFTSLGESGDAPLGWVYMPEINRVPPQPKEFQNPDWYHRMGRVDDWGDFQQVVYGDFPGGLKDLATENPNVRAALIRVFSDWITHTDIDGYRIDTVKHVEHDFWPAFCGAIRDHAASLGKENFLLFGEAFDGDDALIGSYTAPGMLDSVAYFSQKYRAFDGVLKYGAPTAEIARLWEERATNWGTEAQPGGVGVAPVDLPVNFLDNHDVPRFTEELQARPLDEQGPRQAMAIAVLMTAPGVPQLTWGAELGQRGGGDPDNRRDLPGWAFDPASRVGAREGFLGDPAEVFDTVRDWIAVRRAHPALSVGSYAEVWRQNGGVPVWVSLRSAGDDRVIVVVYAGTTPSGPFRVHLQESHEIDDVDKLALPDGVALVPVPARAGVAAGSVRVEGGELVFDGLPPLTAVALEVLCEVTTPRPGPPSARAPAWHSALHSSGRREAFRMRRNEKVTHIMTTAPNTVQVGQKVSEAAALMRDNGYHHVPVVDGKRLVGVLSSTDILRVSYEFGADPRQTDQVLDHTVSIQQLVDAEPVTITTEQTIRDAVDILAEGTFHALPVVDAAGDLAGLVTSTDLLRYLKDQY
ncbi:MAG: alpha-amylase family glycosyl hydrolase [Myxococcota bacterium]